ncbi:PQQ-binding-like beta-propeller repeat protein [Nonomuraea sp. NPDC000554]|uniref:outer membrane protein assembly factor BamB family protein n=1 Tax=Nonomuraea sp. NPDC000554 TaxID=3154259 RepID=UPI00332EB13C
MPSNQTRGTRPVARLLSVVAVSAVIVGTTGAGVFTPATADTPGDYGVAPTWSAPNGNKANTRRVRGPIDSRSVSRLGVAWSVPIKAPSDRWAGSYATTPVVADGVVYTQDLGSNVYAIELRTGRLLWTKMYNAPSSGPNGVNVGDGRVYGATVTSAFALDARTGAELWSKPLVRNKNEGIDMAPGFNDHTVYVSTVPGNPDTFFSGDGVGVLWALDAATGRPKWKWNTVPTDLWGKPEINSGGGLWHPPGFDEKGDLYVSVGNPGPFLGTEEYPWGSSRPGPNLYTNSIVKLDAATGRPLWYQQPLPHDIYDWDLQNSPVLTRAGGRPTVLASGKLGYVYAYDQRTGELLWKTPVGKHNGHDDDNLLALRGEYAKLPQMPFTVYPGVLGGIPAPIAVDDTTVYAAVNNYAANWTNQVVPEFPPFDEATGELVAIDLATGAIKWTHPFGQSPYGAATVANDLVFTTTFDGTVHALNTGTGQEVWQAKLPATSNSPVAVHGDTLLAAGGWPQLPGEKAEIVAYRLGATASTSPSTSGAR